MTISYLIKSILNILSNLWSCLRSLLSPTLRVSSFSGQGPSTGAQSLGREKGFCFKLFSSSSNYLSQTPLTQLQCLNLSEEIVDIY